MSLLVGEIFRRNADVVPERVAASLGPATLTHGELNAAGDRLAHRVRELGIRRGDRVVSWANTCLEVLPLALAKLGAVFAPLNARLGADEATESVRLARPRLLALCEADPHVIFFTSGSTGRPKGVVLSHRANWLRGFQGVFRDEPERSVCMFPLYHMAAFTLAIAAGRLAARSPSSRRRRPSRSWPRPSAAARTASTASQPCGPGSSQRIPRAGTRRACGRSTRARPPRQSS